jgi:HK97 family phage portal protein
MNLRFWRTGAEQKSSDYWPLETPPPADWLTSGLFPMMPERAVGLPAVVAVIRLLSHAAGMVPLLVLRGQDGDVRDRATETWQWRLLHNRPSLPPLTPFAVKADLAAHFAGRGNAYLRKYKPSYVGPGRPRVTALESMHSGRITPRLQSGQVVFEDTTGDRTVTRGTDEVIQIRSFSLGDGLEGLAPITAARFVVEAGLERQKFEGEHLRNGIFPGLSFAFPDTVDLEQGERWAEFLEARHKGSGKRGKLIIVGGGATVAPVPISLEDAQFAEATKLTISQVAAMYQIPQSFVMPEHRQAPTAEDWRFFLTFGLGPFWTAAAEALSTDRDLFADEDDLHCVADVDRLLKLDPLVKAQVQKEQVQSGVRLVDEIRADDGLGPLPPVPKDWTQEPGKVPQITPVGGAPNPMFGTAPSSTNSGPAADGGIDA